MIGIVAGPLQDKSPHLMRASSDALTKDVYVMAKAGVYVQLGGFLLHMAHMMNGAIIGHRNIGYDSQHL